MTSHLQLIQTIRQFMDIAMHHSMHERLHFAKALGLSMPQICRYHSMNDASLDAILGEQISTVEGELKKLL